MNFKPLSNTSLQAKFLLIMGAFITSAIVICILTFYASHATRTAFHKQNQLLGRYHQAFNLSSATSGLLYRSADLSNSLSDAAQNAFEDAQSSLQMLAAETDDSVLSEFIKTTTNQIGARSLEAMDYYINNDRKSGDAVMKHVRTLSQTLQARVLANQMDRLNDLENIQIKTLTIQKNVENSTTLLALLSLFASIALYLVVFHLVIKPIHALVMCLKNAANAPGRASRVHINRSFSGELGEAAAALNLLLDATQNAIEIAERSETRWKTIFNLSPDSIILIDKKTTRILDCNPATIDMLNVGGKDFTQFTAFDFHTHEEEALDIFLKDIHVNGHARADNLSCKLGDQTVPVSVVGVDVPGEQNDTTMLYIRDMSENVAQRRALVAAQQEAEQASEAKSAFLATMSHEIRTPLNGMLGMAQALEASDLPGEDAEKVETIIESGDMLMTILNDVLDISKISAAQMELSLVPDNLAQLLAQTHKLFSAQADDKNLDFTLSVSSDIPETLAFDPVRVRQCLNNLVSNALKFTSEGKVEIEAFLSSSSSKTCTVALRVTDTGLGMSEETRTRVFSPFIQADSSISRKFGGTGLGLAISHELAKMMGGDIAVQSTPDHGSVFTFTFNAERDNAEPASRKKSARKSAQANLSDRSLLLVDDSAINRKVIRTLLSATGIAITEAENGQEALDHMHANTFDLVLLDMHMPVMNGPETIAHIRASTEPWHDIAVVAVTADAMLGDKERYLAMGLDGYITKPIDQRMLFVGIFKALNKARSVSETVRKTA